MTINGHQVKRQNMYDMEEGEGSVWDRELSGKVDAAFQYRERTAPPPGSPAAGRAPKRPRPEREAKDDPSRAAPLPAASLLMASAPFAEIPLCLIEAVVHTGCLRIEEQESHLQEKECGRQIRSFVYVFYNKIILAKII